MAISIIAVPLLTIPVRAKQAGAVQQRDTKAGQLYAFKVERPNFVKVEIWSWPTGTGITQPSLIGTATRVTDPGNHEKWTLRIPRDLLAVKIFAIAFDETGKAVGKRWLPYKGASAVYQALYGNK